MQYEILNDKGAVLNVIVADEAFVKAQYFGQYREVPEPVVVATVGPTGTATEKIVAIRAQLDDLEALLLMAPV